MGITINPLVVAMVFATIERPPEHGQLPRLAHAVAPPQGLHVQPRVPVAVVHHRAAHRWQVGAQAKAARGHEHNKRNALLLLLLAVLAAAGRCCPVCCGCVECFHGGVASSSGRAAVDADGGVGPEAAGRVRLQNLQRLPRYDKEPNVNTQR